jgi:hypothetical protein
MSTLSVTYVDSSPPRQLAEGIVSTTADKSQARTLTLLAEANISDLKIFLSFPFTYPTTKWHPQLTSSLLPNLDLHVYSNTPRLLNTEPNPRAPRLLPTWRLDLLIQVHLRPLTLIDLRAHPRLR